MNRKAYEKKVMKIVMMQCKICLLLVMFGLFAFAQTAWAQTLTPYDYFYRSWNATSKEVTTEIRTCTSYTPINGNKPSGEGSWVVLNNGWYVVTGNSEYEALSVQGDDVHLLIPDMVTLTVKHVKLEAGKKLTIYSQGGDVGKLVANNASGLSDAAGIGGGDEAYAGILVVQGGIVEATGNKYAAGIGGGDQRGFAQSIQQGGLFVYGGTVTAQGGQYAAGIGSGDESADSNSGYVAIYGGKVTATGGDEGAGIGGGNEGNGAMFSIYGGEVTATGGRLGAGIGGGDEGHTATTTFYGGKVTAQGGYHGAGIGGGEDGYATAIEVRGGNITAEGGEGGAGIGGGYGEAGDCRGIFFYDGTVEAKGHDGAAGIGSGHESLYCELTIYGGTIKAWSTGKGPGIGRGMADVAVRDARKTLVTITGGDVTAWSSDGGAGIGTAESTYFKGRIEISGGKVTATGSNGGAGIGTGAMSDKYRSADMYGWIIISGGTINATGKRGGAGIGGGVANEIYDVALIQILGGDVTAYAESGGAIGSGGPKWADTGDGDHFIFSYGDCPIQINGDNVTLHLTPNPAKDYSGINTDVPSAAIKFDANRGGSLSVAGKLAVTVNGVTCQATDRVSILQRTTTVDVVPCPHSSVVYTANGTSTNDTHTKHCNHCGTTFDPEKHTFVDGKCSGCGITGDAVTVTIYLPKDGGTTDGVYETTTYQVNPGTAFNLPGTPTTPAGLEFAGWLVGDATGLTSYVTTTSETLFDVGQAYTINSPVSFTARYKLIELSLYDDQENYATLWKYNNKLVSSITLNGRTLYKDGAWNTLCLPFSLSNFAGTPLEGAIVKTLESAAFDETNGTLTLNFTTDANNLTSIEAGKPYIVKWTSGSNIVDPVFSGVTISNTTADVETAPVTFKGLYAPLNIGSEGDNTKLYLAANNEAYYPDGEMTIGCQRAYFQLADGITAGDKANGAKIMLNFDGTTTGVKEVIEVKEVKDDSWYTLDGRRLNSKPTQKGIYINNGKKVVIK